MCSTTSFAASPAPAADSPVSPSTAEQSRPPPQPHKGIRSREQRKKDEVRGRHMCICPLRDQCVSEHAFTLPGNPDERKKWLELLGINLKDGLEVGLKDARVSATHWSESELKFTESSKLRRAVRGR